MIKERLNKVKNSLAFRLIASLIVLFLIYKFYIWTQTESTDNAYVEADISIISSEVNGRVIKLLINDNQFVETGDVIAEIDTTNYKAGVAKASADLDAAQNAAKITERKIEIQKLEIDKFEEVVSFAKTSFDVADRDYKRTSRLVADNFSTKKLLDDSRVVVDNAKIKLIEAQFNLDSGNKNLTLLELQLLTDSANVIVANQDKILAEHALQNTKIRSPIDGTIANNNIKIGNFVLQGVPLVAVVPTTGLYIKANFKETQVTKFGPLSKVMIEFDGISGVKIDGMVRAIYPASGSKFSLIPPDNATGNFTKVVQRIPVIIDFEIPQELSGIIRAGMSTYVSIRK